MKNGGYQLTRLTDRITLLHGFAQECCMYALEGSEKIALIDTGMGTGDLKAALAAIAPGKQWIAINTHGHADRRTDRPQEARRPSPPADHPASRHRARQRWTAEPRPPAARQAEPPAPHLLLM